MTSFLWKELLEWCVQPPRTPTHPHTRVKMSFCYLNSNERDFKDTEHIIGSFCQQKQVHLKAGVLWKSLPRQKSLTGGYLVGTMKRQGWGGVAHISWVCGYHGGVLDLGCPERDLFKKTMCQYLETPNETVCVGSTTWAGTEEGVPSIQPEQELSILESSEQGGHHCFFPLPCPMMKEPQAVRSGRRTEAWDWEKSTIVSVPSTGSWEPELNNNWEWKEVLNQVRK